MLTNILTQPLIYQVQGFSTELKRFKRIPNYLPAISGHIGSSAYASFYITAVMKFALIFLLISRSFVHSSQPTGQPNEVAVQLKVANANDEYSDPPTTVHRNEKRIVSKLVSVATMRSTRELVGAGARVYFLVGAMLSIVAATIASSRIDRARLRRILPSLTGERPYTNEAEFRSALREQVNFSVGWYYRELEQAQRFVITEYSYFIEEERWVLDNHFGSRVVTLEITFRDTAKRDARSGGGRGGGTGGAGGEPYRHRRRQVELEDVNQQQTSLQERRADLEQAIEFQMESKDDAISIYVQHWMIALRSPHAMALRELKLF